LRGTATSDPAVHLDARRARDLVAGTILERIGDTPLVRLGRLAADLPGEVWVKVEGANPGGSVKDRAALWMVLSAELRGDLDDRRTVLEATSGNMGVALAMVCAVRGHAVELCVPGHASLERRRMAAAFGARIVETDPLDGSDGAIREARGRDAAAPGRYAYLDQYANPLNPLAHRCTTGPEIWAQTDGRVTHLVAGVGTSGTLSGAGAFLRDHGVRVVAVQPDDSFHGLEGLKHMASAMRPAIWDPSAADRHAACSTKDALATVRRLAREEGLFCGPSSGAAVAVALEVARAGPSVVVAVLPDGGERYVSTPLWE
jgi:S-sulfo-L-cysteine synthase (O-acetyl-L-serine-dependent)